MKTSKTPAANDNTAAPTPTVDALLPVLCACVSVQLAWALKGWAARLAETTHQLHAANSWAKHRGEFGDAAPLAHALTVARLIDYGCAPDDAARLIRARVTAYDRKAA